MSDTGTRHDEPGDDETGLEDVLEALNARDVVDAPGRPTRKVVDPADDSEVQPPG